MQDSKNGDVRLVKAMKSMLGIFTALPVVVDKGHQSVKTLPHKEPT